VQQGPDDPCPGYLVSTTPLQDYNYPVTSARRYADARFLPYVAVPIQILQQQGPLLKMLVSGGHTGWYGDSVTAVNLRTNDVGHGIIADTGNKPHFGEGSYALGKAINFLTGTYEPEVLYLVRPASGAGDKVIPGPDAVEAQGEDLFNQFGGLDRVAEVLAAMG
jgi:hypothetical protein